MKNSRLDKFIADNLNITRKQARSLICKGNITVNETIITNSNYQVTLNEDRVYFNSELLIAKPKFQYFLFNKPKGYITASKDRAHNTVVDLLPSYFIKDKIMPVGRLDKDTTGLLLFTNDGELAHRLISPKRAIYKTYIAKIDKLINEEDILTFKNGVELSDFKALPAELKTSEIGEYYAQVKICEGKFHQVKRMFAAIGANVEELDRISFGPLIKDIPIGTIRELTSVEVKELYSICNM
ncbi:MAG: rRNA pseudouridine synthase [Christensenellaceae bacterium]|nr:rRNA pseudouridine synthase [Christensenellaceae bacterium]